MRSRSDHAGWSLQSAAGVTVTPAPPPGPALVIQTAANAVTGILAVSDMLSSFPQETEGGTYYCRGT